MKPIRTMPDDREIELRPLKSHDDFRSAMGLEKAIWGLSDEDVLPLTFIIASQAAGAAWHGAFDGNSLIGFAFGFLGWEGGEAVMHSHMLAVLPQYRDLDVGRRLKMVQRADALEIGIRKITWTFDPLQGKNAHLNFSKLGVVSSKYKVNFYGPETSSLLHRNGTDRLWVEWQLDSSRVAQRLQGEDNRAEIIDAVRNTMPLVRFDGSGRPTRGNLGDALARQKIAIEIPSDINSIEKADAGLSSEWREITRWGFLQALHHGFTVQEFCRSVRGEQGPGAYLLDRNPQ